MRTRCPERLKNFDYLGPYQYSLTFCTDQRRKLFEKQEAVDLVLEQISRTSTELRFAVIAYCFMPDHVHLLIDGKAADSDGKVFIARVKQYSGYHYAKKFNAKLWQRYGYEHVVRDDEVTTVVAKYILENPVRAGLVERVEDYPFAGSLVYTLTELLGGLAQSG